MMLFSILTAPAAAFALTPADVTVSEANVVMPDRVAARVIEMRGPEDSESPMVDEVVREPTPVRLVSWDGDFELLKSSQRMRIWRSHVAYRLDVDASGNVVGCELTETFRRRRVSVRLCDILSANHTFEPAHDESGMPVAGSYAARISYAEIRDRID